AAYTDRRSAMAAAYQAGHYSLAAIARHFNVHYSTVSRAVKAAEAEEER
ncbi:MAG TPA: helix-turn-helix domain-containing protein, partial [Gammaproteobacteria bacterium]|nr:helix-turn-helix domain-containing protein [Gammaproteobacteria bacterium]